MSTTCDSHTTLTIFSFEDEPDTIAGSLDSLAFAGHRIERQGDLSAARRYLEHRDVDLVLLDERVANRDDGGSSLILELKQGALGGRNLDVPFGFVTANAAWVDEPAMASLPGFLGVKVKGGDLTRALEQWIEVLHDPSELERAADEPQDRSTDPPPRRVPLRVAGVQRRGEEAPSLLLSVPAWNPQEQITYPVSEMPPSLRDDPESLAGSWFIARMNLHEPDPTRIVISDWELQEPLDDDDDLG